MSGGDFFNAPKVIRTRKQHQCAYCGYTIPKGTPGVLKESGFWRGQFWESFACRKCQPFVTEFWGWQGVESDDIEWDFDEFMRAFHRDLWVTDDDE